LHFKREKGAEDADAYEWAKRGTGKGDERETEAAGSAAWAELYSPRERCQD